MAIFGQTFMKKIDFFLFAFFCYIQQKHMCCAKIEIKIGSRRKNSTITHAVALQNRNKNLIQERVQLRVLLVYYGSFYVENRTGTS